MWELILIAVIIVIVIIAVCGGKHGNSGSESSNRNCRYSEGIEMARQHAEKIGDTEALQAIADGTYKELLEQRAAKRHASIVPSIATYSYNIAGINFRKGIADYVGDFTGYLNSQPTNRHDPKAIAVYHADGHHLGYIPADETDDVRALHLRFPIPIAGSIIEDYDYDESRRYYIGSITIKVKTK